MASRQNYRRYDKIGDCPTYDHHYEIFKSGSPVLTTEARNHLHQAGDYYNDQRMLESWLLLLSGSEKQPGEYWNNESAQWEKARLPAAEKTLEALLSAYEREKQNAINNGYPLPTQPSKELQERIWVAEARLDVKRLELLRVKERLEVLKEKKTQTTQEEVLKYGPVQSYHSNEQGIIIDIDRQRVSLINDRLVIDDERSPYDGMSVVDYRLMAKRWTEERSDRINREREEARELFRTNGINKFVEPHFNPIAREHLPAWPEGVKNLKKQPVQDTK